MIKYILIGIVGISLVTGSYIKGYNHGVDNTTVKWQEETNQRNKVIKELEDKYKLQAEEYSQETHKLSDKLYEQEINHAKEIASLNASFNSRLFQSEQRAELYKRMSTKTGDTCQTLANHTARLDRQLTEGIDLVRELRAIIELRDSQLRAINQQFKLMEKNNE